jgi:hypothetical protein
VWANLIAAIFTAALVVRGESGGPDQRGGVASYRLFFIFVELSSILYFVLFVFLENQNLS